MRRTLAALARVPVLVLFNKQLYIEDTLEQMDQIGVGSVLIIVVALFCVGGVIVLNAASQFSRFGETVLTGDALSLSLVRELGPVFTALLVAGRTPREWLRNWGPWWLLNRWTRCGRWALTPFAS